MWDVNGGWMRTKLHTTVRRSTATRPSVVATRHLSRARMKPYRAHTPTSQCRPPGARLRDEDDAHQCACVIRLHRHSFQSCSLPPSLRSCAPPVRLCLQQPASASCKVDSCHVVPGPGRNRSTSQVSTGLAQCVGVAQCVVS